MSETADHPLVRTWPSGGAEHSRRIGRTVLWTVVAVTMLADVVTTVVGVRYGLHEGNALVRTALTVYGPAGLVAVKVVVLSLAGATAVAVPDRVSPVIPVALTLPTLVAVAVNLVLVGAA